MNLPISSALHRNAYEWFENVNQQWMVAIGALVAENTVVGNTPSSCKCIAEVGGPDNADTFLNISQTECSNTEGSTMPWREGESPSPQIHLALNLEEKCSRPLSESLQIGQGRSHL